MTTRKGNCWGWRSRLWRISRGAGIPVRCTTNTGTPSTGRGGM
ncbi:hypothetical protein [uncultured Chitinophaga sp.]